MSIPINQQKQLIEKYLDLLVKEFITDPRHNKDISTVFVDHLKNSKKNSITLGHTGQSGGGSKTNKNTTWTTINGVKVPGSEKTATTTTYFPYKYVITFLNNYKNMDELRGTVVHEFTHLYLFSTVGDHDHDIRFYSTMERLENWLDKNQGLSPRVDKSHDRDQLEDTHSETINDEEEGTCPECSCTSPHHSPHCSQNQTGSHPTNQSEPEQKSDITNDPQKVAKFNSLKGMLESSRDLKTLETVYQIIKNNPLYQGENCSDNKKTIDSLYRQKKQFLNNNRNFSTNSPDSSNKSGLGSREYLLIALVAAGIILVVVIAYFLMSENQTSAKSKKKQ